MGNFLIENEHAAHNKNLHGLSKFICTHNIFIYKCLSQQLKSIWLYAVPKINLLTS